MRQYNLNSKETNHPNEFSKNQNLADIFTRWKAWVLDGFFIFLGVIPLSISLLGIFAKIFGVIDTPFFRQGWVALFILPFSIFLLPIYFVIMHGKYGQTLGKMAFGTKVVKYNGEPISYFTAFIRALGFYINSITIIGWLWVFFDDKNRGFHDLIARTIVVRCEAKPEIKSFMVKIILISLILVIVAMFVTGGITVEHHRVYP